MDTSSNHARISKNDYPVIRLKLRAWLQLEDIRSGISDAVKNKNRDSMVLSLYSYVSMALSVPVEELQECPWYEVARAYYLIYRENLPNIELPIIRPRKTKKENEIEDFDYPGRSWYMWAHMVAKSYGWTLEYIAELDVDEAISLIQEILYNEQSEREWQWGMSEIAYSYDSNTKKSQFVPLKRPEWMQPTYKEEEVKKVRFKKSELPVGLIMRWDNGKSTSHQ